MLTMHVAHGGRCTCFANTCQDASVVLQESEARDESVDGGGRMMAEVSSFYRK